MAVGECGLDFHYDNSPRETQLAVFRRQMELAIEADLPVVVHNRSSDEAMLEAVLRDELAALRADFHSFAGSLEMARALIERVARAMNRPVPEIDPGAMRILERYEWRGNVRELANALERALVVQRGNRIRHGDLPFRITTPGYEAGDDGGGKALSLAEVERGHIARVLEETGWNISMAARLLGVDRTTVYNKIKLHGLQQR